MALIKCKECGEEISNKADKCPKCGIKIQKAGIITYIGIFILFIWIIGKFIPDSSGPNNFGNSTQETKNIDYNSLTEITPRELVWAYESNTVAADQDLKGKYFKVTGEVVSINTDFTGDPYLIMKGTRNEFNNPHFKFDKSHSSELANIYPGTTITIACKGAGDIAKTPMSDSCVIIK